MNVPLCTASGSKGGFDTVSDGAGGAIVTWTDRRSGNWDIYAQRISSDGTIQWTVDGVELGTGGPGYNSDGWAPVPAIASDGASGAIVTWAVCPDGNTVRVYAQRISAAGVVKWTSGGVALAPDPPFPQQAGLQLGRAIVSDNAGGAIVTWYEYRNDISITSTDVYAQRISADGVIQWGLGGVPVCTADGEQYNPQITSDGGDGAIITWSDGRSGNFHIYAQRIDFLGVVRWTRDGVALCTATSGLAPAHILSDDAGGAIVEWEDDRSGNWDLYAQRISADGAAEWAVDGVALCTLINRQGYATITSDEASGAIVTWEDNRNGYADVFAQRINSVGVVQWTVDGLALCSAPGIRNRPTIASDGAGGAIVTWDAWLPGSSIYAQRISVDGTPQWGSEGVALSTAASGPSIVWDGAGGAIVACGKALGIYAQRVQANGQLGGGVLGVRDEAVLNFALDPASPNPAHGRSLKVRFTLPSAAPARVELLDVAGRRIAAREVGSLGAGTHTLDLGSGQLLAPGLYLVRLRQDSNARVARIAVLR